MRILYMVPYVPNLIRVRPYNLIRSLAERGHQVTLVTLWSSEAEQRDAEALKGVCETVTALPLTKRQTLRNLASALLSNMPLQANYCWQPDLYQVMRTLLSPNDSRITFDLVHIEHLRGVRYGTMLQRDPNIKGKIPFVWDSVDCISYLFEQAIRENRYSPRRLALQFDLGRTRRYEGEMVNSFRQVLVTSPIDLEKLKALAPQGAQNSNLSVVPNGVDLDYFCPDLSVAREPDSLVISGKMSYHANIAMAAHLVQDIMPMVWARRPAVTVKIVGKDPPKEIRTMAQNPNVIVTGTVADLRPYLRKASIAVAPLPYGAGIQNKVLEAMACGAPVIASPQAVSALNIKPGIEAIVADSPQEFANAILSLLSEHEKCGMIGLAGLRYVQRYHSWSTITSQLDAIYQNALCDGKGA